MYNNWLYPFGEIIKGQCHLTDRPIVNDKDHATLKKAPNFLTE